MSTSNFEKKAKIIEIVLNSVGTLLTILVILISINQFSSSLKTSFVQLKAETQLSQIGELPAQVAELCNVASTVAVVVWVGEDNIDETSKAEYVRARDKEDELLNQIQSKIYAYGSKEAIEIYNEFTRIIYDNDGGYISIEAFYLLPLLLSQVKLDVTGETVQPVTFIESLMPQFREHKELADEYIKRKIKELKLVSLEEVLSRER
jgi:hypothetical protein